MLVVDTDTLMFFEGHRAALPLFLEFETFLDSAFPVVNKRVCRTQISYFNRHVFACVSFAAVKRKADLPEGYMVITLCLPARLDSDRAAVKVETYPGRWTHHFVVSSPDELDEEFRIFVREAYNFAYIK